MRIQAERQSRRENESRKAFLKKQQKLSAGKVAIEWILVMFGAIGACLAFLAFATFSSSSDYKRMGSECTQFAGTNQYRCESHYFGEPNYSIDDQADHYYYEP